MLFKRAKPVNPATEIFPLTDTLIDFDDTIATTPNHQRRKHKLSRAPAKRSIAQKWMIALSLTGLHLLATIVLFQVDLIKLSTVFALLGMLAAMVAVFFVVFQLKLNLHFHERRLKLPIISTAFICMLVVFYLDPATQIIFTPFAFIAIAYGMYRISTGQLLLLALGVFFALALIIGLHYQQGHNLALLRLEAMHFIALLLSLPAFIFLIGKVQHLHRVLNKASRKIKYIQADAKRDVLIDCFNRRYMVVALEEHKLLADENGSPLCLAVIDLDHFKRINDEVGHLGGDEVLRTFAKVAQENVRASDIFGRYGGEEFLLIFPDTSLLPALNTSERIRAQIEHFPWQGALQHRVSVSIGVTQYIPGESVLELFSRTDTAMYMAKQGGRNQVVVEEPVALPAESK
ncbi:diguanylate cyclase [Undibacterium sp. Ren11W]|uniref:GGDEF domain-containing protein n=1 Tax=Undibacterium sp. Ren11W TaxID=3413045 RepID=UPI003BEFBF0F